MLKMERKRVEGTIIDQVCKLLQSYDIPASVYDSLLDEITMDILCLENSYTSSLKKVNRLEDENIKLQHLLANS